MAEAAGKQQKVIRSGACPTDGISDYLKVHLTHNELGITVVGYIGEGSSGQLTSNWSSPFESDNVGSVSGAESAAGLLQTWSGYTSVGSMNSTMVWQGVMPPSFQLSLYFQAIRDAKLEVNDPIMHLQQMSSPELNKVMPLGRVPANCVLDLGRRLKIENLIIQDVGYELDAPRTKDGYFTHNTVTLQCCAKRMLNASEIKNAFI